MKEVTTVVESAGVTPPLVLFFPSELEIVGFIEIGDIASPPVLSRHLVLPIAVNKGSPLISRFHICC